jgi:predicted RNA-binding Zn-ribbon protein involved in translation (DUF1610 family)
MKILILDIEISPTIAALWGLFNQNIPIGNIRGESEVLSWSAKWHGSEECEFSSLRMVGHTPAGKKRMLREIHKLLDQADAVVTYNGNGFDLKILNKEFLMQGMAPPAPYKSIDLLAVMRRKFRWTSNKLDYVVKQLGLGQKTKHAGMDMWLTCMTKGSEGYHEAWDMMEEYNVNDVFLTEELYDAVVGWIHNPVNHSADQNAHVCPYCGSKHVQKRGNYISKTLVYKRYQCQGCGGWSHGKVAEKADRSAQLVPAK